MKTVLAAIVVAMIIGVHAGSDIAPGEYRPFNGTGNNINNPTWGAAFSPYIRLNIPNIYYSDNKFSPRAYMVDGRIYPSGRQISNRLFARQHLLTPRNVSDVHTYYGMVITGDISSVAQNVPALGGETPLLIPVPMCDPFFDVACTGTSIIFCLRNTAFPGTGTATGNPRQHFNTNTHFIDLSNVYGNGCTTGGLCPPWRTGNGGHITKVWYTFFLKLVPQQTQWFMGGDIRINKTPPVTSIIETYHREHNRLADQFAAQNPSWSDEQLFQEARKWLIAFHQKISTREYLGALLGEPLDPYAGYNPNTNPSLENAFPANSFRYGHPEINSVMRRTDAAGNEIPEGNYVTRDVLFKPLITTFNQVGIEPVLLGLTYSIQGLIGLGWSNDVRNMPFGGITPSYGPLNDLAAINIHRSRDQGLPNYNMMRVAYGFPPKTTWAEFSNDTDIQQGLASLYTTPDDVDAYVGGIIEPHKPAAALGELWWTMVKEQFSRSRNGDRFWYENPNGQFTADEISEIYNTTLPLIIMRNTNITGLEQNIFFTKARALPDAASGLGVLFSDDNMAAHIDLSPTYRLGWTINDTTQCVDFRLQVATQGWVGIGFQPDLNTMKNADIVLSRYFPENDTFEIHDCYARDVGVPTFDTDPVLNGTDNILNKRVSIQRGLVIVEFSKPFDSGDKWDKVLSPGAKKIIFAYNPTETAFVYHGPTRSASYTIDFWNIPGQLTEEKNATGLIIAIAILLGLLGLACLLTLIMVIANLDHPIVRYATPLFCVITLCGILTSLAGLATQLADPTDALCMINFWLMGAGFMLTFGSVFVKSWRIWRVLTAAQKLERQIISQGVLGGIVGVALLLELIFMAIWQGVDPLKVTQVDISGSDTQYKMACRANSDGFLVAWIVYKGFSMLIGLFLAFKVKDSFREFNESKGMVGSIYVVSLVVFFCIPLGFGLRGYPNIELVIEAIGILFAYTGVLIALFWDKFRVIVLKDELDDGRSFTFRSQSGSLKSNAGASSAQSTASVSN